jgi:biopolymer transport protein ExbB
MCLIHRELLMNNEMHRTRAMAVLAMAALVMMAAYCVAAEPAKTGAAKTEAAATDSTAEETTAASNGQPAIKFRQYYLWSEPAGIALIAYSAIGLALILERLFAWAAVGASSGQIRRQIKGLLSSPDRNLLLATFQKSKAPLSRVMADVLENGVTNSPETTQLLMENALDSVERRLKRNLALLACVAGTAPFLGLFGTVLGIMDTFNSIAKEGFGGPAVISHGIGQALITTAGGLAVAIPTFIAYNLFIAKANNKIGELREQASRIFVALGDL